MSKKFMKVQRIILLLLLIVGIAGNQMFFVLATESEVSQRSAEIITGTYGTSPWRIESDGTLYIGAGEFLSNSDERSPWYDVREVINKIVFEGEVIAEGEQSYLFAHLWGVEIIENIELLNTSNVTDMSGMFRNTGLTSLDLSSWDTSNVTDMRAMFSESLGLTSLDLSLWDTSSVTDMSEMFWMVGGVASSDLSLWDTSNVTNMRDMFRDTGVDDMVGLSSWDTSSVTDMSGMFKMLMFRRSDLTSLDLSSWDTSSVTNMSEMFSSRSDLTDLDISSWDTSSVTNMREMFGYARNLTSLDISSWDTSSVTNASGMFFGASSLTSLDLSSWNTSITDMSYIFSFSNLKMLTLGKEFSAFTEPMFNQQNIQNTGFWQNIGSGTIENPLGTYIFTFAELMEKYDGETMADTYVWRAELPTESESETESEPPTESESKTEAEPPTESESETKSELQIESKSESESETEPKQQTESESQTEATSIINIENGKTTSPKTGDGTSLLGLMGLLIGSLSIVFVLSKRKKMK